MNDKTVSLTFDSDQLTVIMDESYTFRKILAERMVNSAVPAPSFTNVSEVAFLKDYVKRTYREDSRIAAVKYVREWALTNHHTPLLSLTDAKNFVWELIPTTVR